MARKVTPPRSAEITKRPPRPEALAMVKTVLDNSTRDDISAADLRRLVRIFNMLDAAHKAMARSWDQEPEDFLAAIARLKEADRVFWTELDKVMPIARDRLESMIEGEARRKM